MPTIKIPCEGKVNLSNSDNEPNLVARIERSLPNTLLECSTMKEIIPVNPYLFILDQTGDHPIMVQSYYNVTNIYHRTKEVGIVIECEIGKRVHPMFTRERGPTYELEFIIAVDNTTWETVVLAFDKLRKQWELEQDRFMKQVDITIDALKAGKLPVFDS